MDMRFFQEAQGVAWLPSGPCLSLLRLDSADGMDDDLSCSD